MKENWELRLVDWESVSYNDIEVDLVSFIYNSKLNVNQVRLFQESY